MSRWDMGWRALLFIIMGREGIIVFEGGATWMIRRHEIVCGGGGGGGGGGGRVVRKLREAAVLSSEKQLSFKFF